jgi:hypothetical protein
MPKRQRRKPDMRRIRPSATYTIPQLARAVERRVETVRRWHREGMPALNDTQPLIFDGAEVKEWLRRKWSSRKQRCAKNEAYCTKCRVPRRFATGTTQLTAMNEKMAMIRGSCDVCGTPMNRFQSAQHASNQEPLAVRSKQECAA